MNCPSNLKYVDNFKIVRGQSLPMDNCPRKLQGKKVKTKKNKQERWAFGNVHAVHDEWSETFAKSRSWYVRFHVSKTKDQ